MKTITKDYNIYSFEELSQEAKDKAREAYNKDLESPFLQADLREYIHEELIERGYTHGEITPLYDLSNCQGSGLMFEGIIEDKKGNVYNIKQLGRYFHERSTEISAHNNKGGEIDATKWEESVYIPICKIVRDRGYEDIEYSESEEYFAETCEANEYTFLEDGRMFNE